MGQSDGKERIDDPPQAHLGVDQYEAALRWAQLSIVVTDPKLDDNPIVFANDAFLTMTGYSRQDVAGRNCRFLQGPATASDATLSIRQALLDRANISIDILNYRKDGEPFWNALRISPIFDAQGALQFFFGTQVDVTDKYRREHEFERIEAERTRRISELEMTLAVQSVLIREIDHRAKNNLQMVSAMLTLQAMSISDPEVRTSLQEMLDRVNALGLVHQRLYQLSQVSQFDLADFIREIVGDIVGASGRKDIVVDLRLDQVLIAADAAASVGLIVNEALTNAVKHAFKDGRSGRLSVDLALADGRCAITITDDGLGVSAPRGGGTSFGTTLLETMAKQLHAQVEWLRADPGTIFRVSFPLDAA